MEHEWWLTSWFSHENKASIDELSQSLGVLVKELDWVLDWMYILDFVRAIQITMLCNDIETWIRSMDSLFESLNRSIETSQEISDDTKIRFQSQSRQFLQIIKLLIRKRQKALSILAGLDSKNTID